MAKITVDNREYAIADGDRNLLDVCLELGLDIPYFCWHPAIHSVGACRVCAVKQFKDASDTQGKLVMACMTPATDGVRISIDDPEAKAFRARVIEWLMVNHPHDCPVCDEGGECHLQDMTVLAGHVCRRYRFSKRTHRNQELGPFVNHEMNRCIQCYRCVRFYVDYAGGRDFGVFGWHDDVYFGRHADGALENEFSGNLVEVCPTGVFTDKTLKRHTTRKWDLETAPSVCVHCGLGCNIFPGARYGTLRRVHSRYSAEVNRYFLCDRGRYGYEFVNSDRRIRGPMVEGKPAGREEAVLRAASILREGRVIGIGSPRASVETNYALRKLVGAERFSSGLAEKDSQFLAAVLGILHDGPAPAASLAEAETSDAVLVLGEDVTNTAPMLSLALRQAVRQKPVAEAMKLGIHRWDDANLREASQEARGPLFIASSDATKLDEAATGTYRGSPEEIARLGFAVAHLIDPAAPAPVGMTDSAMKLAGQIAEALKGSERPLVVSGVSSGSEDAVCAAANVAWALVRMGRPAKLTFTVPECNSMGLAMMGGMSLESALEMVRRGEADTVLIAENDLFRRLDGELANELLSRARNVIVIDHLETATSARAVVALPAATFAEASGTLVNHEGRAQRFFRVLAGAGEIQESWRWVRDILSAGHGAASTWRNLDEVLAAMETELPQFRGIAGVAPAASWRAVGQRIARQPHRWSGGTANTANLDVHEPTPPEDADSAMSHSMEGFQGLAPAALNPRYWAPGWNSVQAVHKYQAGAGGPLIDPGGTGASRRLVEPAAGAKAEYFTKIPGAFARRDGEWLVVPAHHIFGSEELSVLSPGVAELSPPAYVAVSLADAARLKLNAGENVELALDGKVLRLTLRTRAGLPDGVAAAPVGLAGMGAAGLPAWGKLRRAAGDAERTGKPT